MIDEMFDRQYQAGRARLNAEIGKSASAIGRALGDTFRVLHRIQWSAPWSPPVRQSHRR